MTFERIAHYVIYADCDAVKTPDPEHECPVCFHQAPWTDGRMIAAGDDRDEFWCQRCGWVDALSADEARRLRSAR